MNQIAPIGVQPGTVRIRLRCLGPFRLDDEQGNELHVRTRKARALLAYLALTPGGSSRERLADLLWSDRGPEQARSSLRQTIYEMRHFDRGGAPLVSNGRDGVTVDPALIATDLSLCARAAQAGDYEQLAELLADGREGLLADLDGLDPQFDCWLRDQRAHEPGRTLGAALAAAERCLADNGPRAAQPIVAEIQRLDPTNEEAARLAMRIDHATANRSALHRHFCSLRDRLRDDLDAEPSGETLALFQRLSADARDGDRPAPAAKPDGAAPAPGAARRWAPALAASLLLLVPVGMLAAPSLVSRPTAAAPASQPIVLAVLPFEEEPKGDGFLASGLWEHTRAALSRNGSLRLLGRASTTALAEQGFSPEKYRERFGVTHVLEGAVRRSGDQLEVSVSLSRTSDGLALWQDMFRGRMAEPLALHDAIARGIEGKLRGRLARDGGRLAEHIVTTPEVYSLYNQARQLIASRDPANFRRAGALLREAVAKDPNYAPAWSLLGAAIYFDGRVAIVDALARTEAVSAVRRSLALAPNLAQGHATLALIEGERSPGAERALRKAVALDPNYSDAWNWLGNSLAGQYRYREAIAAYRQAVAIDPLSRAAVFNLSGIAGVMRDEAAIEQLIGQIVKAGADPLLVASVRANRLYLRGDYSGAAKLLLGVGLDANGRTPPALWMNWLDTLGALGRFDVMHAITGCPDWYAPLLRAEVMPPKAFDGRAVLPEEFWTSIFFSAPAARAMVRRGQPEELVKLYRDAFPNADAFISLTGKHGTLNGIAPTLAAALAATGSRSEANYILAVAAKQLQAAIARSGSRWARAELAGIRSAQGEHGQALALLASATAQGWLPNGRDVALDLAQEPAFRALRGDPRFQSMRKHILDHVERERAELGPLKV